MSLAALQRRITAHHEAAHAVIALRHTIPLKEVVVCSEKPTNGYVHFSHGALIYRSRKSLLGFSWPAIVRDTKQHAMAYLAGPLAEARLLGTALRSGCCESDFCQCLALCRALSRYRQHLVGTRASAIPEIDPVKLANSLRDETRRMLWRPAIWQAVTELAFDLENWSRLTGQDAADTVQWAQRTQDQLTLLLPMPSRTDAVASITARL